MAEPPNKRKRDAWTDDPVREAKSTRGGSGTIAPEVARVGRLLDEIERADALLRLYPADHPMPLAKLDAVAASLQRVAEELAPLDVLITRGQFIFRGAVAHENRSPSLGLAMRLHEAGLRALRLGPELDRAGLIAFLLALRTAGEAGDDKEDLLPALLWEADLAGLAFVGIEDEEDHDPLDAAVDRTLGGAGGSLDDLVARLAEAGAAGGREAPRGRAGSDGSALKEAATDAIGAPRRRDLPPPGRSADTDKIKALAEAPRLVAAGETPGPRTEAVGVPRGPVAHLDGEILSMLDTLRAGEPEFEPTAGFVRALSLTLARPELAGVEDRLAGAVIRTVDHQIAGRELKLARGSVDRLRAAIGEGGAGTIGPRVLAAVLDGLTEARRLAPVVELTRDEARADEAFGYLGALDRRVVAALGVATPGATPARLAGLLSALFREEPAALLALLRSPSSAIAGGAAHAVVRLKPALGRVDLGELFRAAPAAAKAEVLRTFETLEPGATASLVIAALGEADGEVRRAALEILGLRPAAGAYRALVEHQRDRAFSSRPQKEQQLHLYALVRANEPQGLALIEQLVTSQPLLGRAAWLVTAVAAIGALAQVGPAARIVLERAARHGPPEVRDAAGFALEKTKGKP